MSDKDKQKKLQNNTQERPASTEYVKKSQVQNSGDKKKR